MKIQKKIFYAALHMVIQTANGALSGAATGALGAAVMSRANYPGYDSGEMAKIGAAGGAVIGAAWSLFRDSMHWLDQYYDFLKRTEAERDRHIYIPSLKMGLLELGILSWGLFAAAGALGQVMLKSQTNMATREAAISTVVGEATIAAGILALAVAVAVVALPIIVIVLCCCNNSPTPRSGIRIPISSFGIFGRSASAAAPDADFPSTFAPNDVELAEVQTATARATV